MARSVNPPRGMRDFLAQDKERRERVLSVIRSVYRAHGFDEIETPVMEDSSRLHAGLGGDNEKLAFGVLKRGLTADDLHAANDPLELADLGLRFDLTVPLTRFYATHRAELPSVFRSIQIAPVWRAERPQKGRYRQFLQCDIDIIGEAGPLAEVELLGATADTMDALGIDGWSLRINDRRILHSLLRHWKIEPEDSERVLIALDKEDKIGVQGVVDELAELGFGDAELIASVLLGGELTELADDGWSLDAAEAPAWLDLEVYAELRALRDALPQARVVFSPILVRGMGYYTGTIFEIAHPSSTSSLGGGGRYDGMIGRFLGTDVPAAGFSIGFERILDLVRLPQAEATDAVVLLYDANVAPPTLLALKSALLAIGAPGGRRVRLERRPRNLKPLLEQLSASGFGQFAAVTAATTSIDELEFRPLLAQE
ncbi:MAG TPA: ATP phosphoribosyltransferase regulatory subunit [Lacisediminihabitans sp.]|nr:ATP phosphoribosyltransferase regulatory subunit [Lacisediminihabitans sp.]HXD61756.1 ATP phosphoribosyltransferase regulatory subunit [Lacisediminihabitans sp.]